MTIQAIRQKLDAVLDAYRDDLDNKTIAEAREQSEAVKAAQTALAAYIVQGAAPCPSCGGVPHGMIQVWSVEKQEIEGIEIGCTRCYDHCAVAFMSEEDDRLEVLREQCVRKWNAGPRRWYRAKGATVLFEADEKTGEVFLCKATEKGHPSKTERMSCKVATFTDSELEAFAVGKKLEDETEARFRLNLEMLKRRDARVTAFREKHGARPEDREVFTVA
jgi:hypothetical protein